MDQEVGRRGKPEEACVWLLVCLFRLSIMRLSPYSHCCWMNPNILMVLYFDIKIDIHWSFCEQNVVQTQYEIACRINHLTSIAQLLVLFSWQADRDDVIVTREALEAGPAIFQRFRQTTNPVTKEFYHKHDPAKATKESIDTILQKNSKDKHRKGWKWLLVDYSHPDVCSTWNVVSVLSISVLELRKLKSLVMDPTPSLATPGLPKYGATFEKEIWWGMSDASRQKCKMASICHPSVIHIHWFQCRHSTCMSPIYHSGCRSDWMTVFPPSPRYPDVWSMSQLCSTTVDPPFHSHDPQPQGPKTAPRPKEKKPEETKSRGSQCHDFPLILLIRFLDHFRFYTFTVCFFQFASIPCWITSFFDRRSFWRPESAGASFAHSYIRSYGIVSWLLILQMSHVTRLFNIDHRLYSTCACVLCHCWRITS